MQMLALAQAALHKNAATCAVYEYPIEDKDINGAVAHINGRYPAQGYVVNTVSKELAYVISGSGKIVVGDNQKMVNQGDMILIQPGEQYHWEGVMTLFLACTPAWYPEQHKVVK